MKTIDDVVSECVKRFGLEVNERNREKYAAFLNRQLSKHPEYDLNFIPKGKRTNPYPLFLVDTMMIFSYLIKESKVKTHALGEGSLLTDETLTAMRVRGNGSYLWDDQTLSSIYSRRAQGHKEHKLPRYTDIINELGKDQEVVAVWGRHISYEADVSSQQASPRARAFRQGRSPFTPKMGRLGR